MLPNEMELAEVINAGVAVDSLMRNPARGFLILQEKLKFIEAAALFELRTTSKENLEVARAVYNTIVKVRNLPNDIIEKGLEISKSLDGDHEIIRLRKDDSVLNN